MLGWRTRESFAIAVLWTLVLLASGSALAQPKGWRHVPSITVVGPNADGDPAKLMCGRPAPCRPSLFKSDAARFFPLTDDEKRALGTMYAVGWKPST